MIFHWEISDTVWCALIEAPILNDEMYVSVVSQIYIYCYMFVERIDRSYRQPFRFHDDRLPWPSDDGKTSQWQRYALVIITLGQTRGMRAYSRFQCAAMLSSSFSCARVLRLFRRRHMSRCLSPNQSDVAMLEEIP